tara:strand:- start:470 stop:1135 length:666 start_codon:yes stop_codon:yes gene_type:complete
MTPTEIIDMFKSYTDEADRTFLTDSQIDLYLRGAYSDFRREVCNTDPFIYLKEHLFTISSTNILDLTSSVPPLAGPTAAAGNKLERLLRVGKINSIADNNLVEYLDASPSELGMSLFGYALITDKVVFGGISDGSYRLEYVPTHNISFNPAGVSPYLDDLDSFHDMIPLYAYRRYAIRDGADSPQILAEMANKKFALADFLQSGRSHEGSAYVRRSYDGSW